MPEKRTVATAESTRPQFRDLVDIHRGKLLIGLAVVALLLGGTWFYNRSVILKRQRAETAYFRARQVAEQGNIDRAITDLRATAMRYKGTSAGTQAALTLAQIHFDAGKPRDGLAVLRDAEGTAPDHFKASVHAVSAAGHEQLNQFVEAARAYRRAADETRFPKERLIYRASEARAYMAAGRHNDALAIWRELADDPDQTLAAEARVRIGELTARPAGS